LINLRYHIVSITAVFLALGLGIAMGSTFLGKATVDQINKNVQGARREVQETRAENARLREAVDRFEQRGEDLTEQSAGRLFEGRLEDVPVVVIAAPGVDEDSLDDLLAAVQGSSARFEGTLVATDKLGLAENDAAELAEILDSATTDPVQLRRLVASGVAEELSAAARRSSAMTAPSSVPELIGQLIAGGFLDYSPAPEGGSPEGLLTDGGYRYVVVSGPDPELPDSDFIQPLLRAITANRPAPLVVASAATGEDPEAVRGAVIDPLLEDDTLADRISTVDDLESFSGVAAVIMALEDIGRGRRGHYGVGEGVSDLLPPGPDE